MPRFESEARKMVEVLGLKWAPIAGKFSVGAKETGDYSRKSSICDAFNAVKQEGVVLTLSKENCVCPGGRHFAGLEIVQLETLTPALTAKKHRIYESTHIAFASISKQPQPVWRGDSLTLGPLDKFEMDPDLIFLFANPAQADKVLGLLSFRRAEPFMYYPASSICSTITNVLANGRPEINMISTFERRAGKWSPNELMLAMPLRDYEEAMRNIPYSGYGAAEISTK